MAARTTTAMRGSKAGQQAHNKQAGQQAHNNQTDNANVSDLAQHELQTSIESLITAHNKNKAHNVTKRTTKTQAVR